MNTTIALRDIIGWVVAVLGPLAALYLGFHEWRKEFRPSVSREVSKDLGLIEAAEQEVWLSGINALGPLHQGREKFIQLLTRGGSLRVLMLDPDSAAGKERAAFENDTAGRLRAEHLAAVTICRDILTNAKRHDGVAVRLLDTAPKRSLVFTDPEMIGGRLNVNEYPANRGTRGLVGSHRTYSREMHTAAESSNIFNVLKRDFETDWHAAKVVNLAPPTAPAG